MDHSFSTVIFAAGLSERMDRPKAMLKWNSSTTFIEKIIQTFSEAGSSLIICMINKQIEAFCKSLIVPENVRFIVNQHPEWGRFYSVRTGLREVRKYRFCFIHNVDNPFISKDVIERISEQKEINSWCSPVFGERGGHPVLLSNGIILKIAETESLTANLSDILNNYPKIKVEIPNDTILRNINTPKDYNTYFNPEIF